MNHWYPAEGSSWDLTLHRNSIEVASNYVSITVSGLETCHSDLVRYLIVVCWCDYSWSFHRILISCHVLSFNLSIIYHTSHIYIYGTYYVPYISDIISYHKFCIIYYHSITSFTLSYCTRSFPNFISFPYPVTVHGICSDPSAIICFVLLTNWAIFDKLVQTWHCTDFLFFWLFRCGFSKLSPKTLPKRPCLKVNLPNRQWISLDFVRDMHSIPRGEDNAEVGASPWVAFRGA